MKHLIMGTAGHVDHGKTTLIKSLTGFDCDTHPEEKTRGITINLGFSYLDYDDSTKIGIVDVPGHKNFVHTMVGGAFGIDFVLLVIAADSGIMPQTREHLKILEILGVEKGIVVLNKIDLVDDEELREISRDEVMDLLRGTCLENAPVMEASAVTGEGMDELKSAIFNLSQTIDEKKRSDIFRLYIDRIFSVSGFGTVVTGTVMGGSVTASDTVHLLPTDKSELRIRRIERHGEEVAEIKAGDRGSINLVGLDREDVQRGFLLSDRRLESTTRVDVALSVFDNVPSLDLWTQVIFLCGTNDVRARVHLLDKESLKGGETALAQIDFSKPVVIFNDDRFVIRNSSSDVTLGGGTILDAYPLHHKRRTEKMIKEVTKIAGGELSDLVFAEVMKRYRIVDHREIADGLNVSVDDVLAVVKNGLPEEIYHCTHEGDTILLLRSEFERIRERVLVRIKGAHRRNPYERKGMTVSAFSSIFSFERKSPGETFLKHVMELLERETLLKRVDDTWALVGHEVVLDDAMKKSVAFLDTYLKRWGMQTPLMSEMVPDAKRQGISETELKQVLHYLTATKKVCEIDGNHLHSSIVDSCRNALLNALVENDGGVRVADFRDLVGGNRKICLLLLSQFDQEEIVERSGDFRVMTKKGREALNGE